MHYCSEHRIKIGIKLKLIVFPHVKFHNNLIPGCWVASGLADYRVIRNESAMQIPIHIDKKANQESGLLATISKLE